MDPPKGAHNVTSTNDILLEEIFNQKGQKTRINTGITDSSTESPQSTTNVAPSDVNINSTGSTRGCVSSSETILGSIFSPPQQYEQFPTNLEDNHPSVTENIPGTNENTQNSIAVPTSKPSRHSTGSYNSPIDNILENSAFLDNVLTSSASPSEIYSSSPHLFDDITLYPDSFKQSDMAKRVVVLNKVDDDVFDDKPDTVQRETVGVKPNVVESGTVVKSGTGILKSRLTLSTEGDEDLPNWAKREEVPFTSYTDQKLVFDNELSTDPVTSDTTRFANPQSDKIFVKHNKAESENIDLYNDNSEDESLDKIPEDLLKITPNRFAKAIRLGGNVSKSLDISGDCDVDESDILLSKSLNYNNGSGSFHLSRSFDLPETLRDVSPTSFDKIVKPKQFCQSGDSNSSDISPEDLNLKTAEVSNTSGDSQQKISPDIAGDKSGRDCSSDGNINENITEITPVIKIDNSTFDVHKTRSQVEDTPLQNAEGSESTTKGHANDKQMPSNTDDNCTKTNIGALSACGKQNHSKADDFSVSRIAQTRENQESGTDGSVKHTVKSQVTAENLKTEKAGCVKAIPLGITQLKGPSDSVTQGISATVVRDKTQTKSKLKKQSSIDAGKSGNKKGNATKLTRANESLEETIKEKIHNTSTILEKVSIKQPAMSKTRPKSSCKTGNAVSDKSSSTSKKGKLSPRDHVVNTKKDKGSNSPRDQTKNSPKGKLKHSPRDISSQEKSHKQLKAASTAVNDNPVDAEISSGSTENSTSNVENSFGVSELSSTVQAEIDAGVEEMFQQSMQTPIKIKQPKVKNIPGTTKLTENDQILQDPLLSCYNILPVVKRKSTDVTQTTPTSSAGRMDDHVEEIPAKSDIATGGAEQIGSPTGVTTAAWEIDTASLAQPRRKQRHVAAKEKAAKEFHSDEAYTPAPNTATIADMARRKVLDLRRWYCISRPQYKSSCGISSLISCWNYLFSTLGSGSKQPITQEEALTVLGFSPPFGEIRFGPFTGNKTLMRWFKQLNDYYGVRGNSYFHYKPQGQNKTLGVTNEEALRNLKKGLRGDEVAYIYHCQNHYFCPMGFEEVPIKAADAFRPNLREDETETWIIIGEPSRKQPCMHCKTWEDVTTDLTNQNPDYVDIRRMWKGPLKRKKTGGNLHCIMAFTRSKYQAIHIRAVSAGVPRSGQQSRSQGQRPQSARSPSAADVLGGGDFNRDVESDDEKETTDEESD